MRASRITIALSAALATLTLAAPASADIDITSFEVSSSSTRAGDHPNLTTKLTLADPGEPEVASNVRVDLPRGMFGNPEAATPCAAADFAQQQCPVNSQVGIVTVWARYVDDPDTLLGTAPIFNLAPGADQTALFGFITPKLHNPVSIPVVVRTGSDYGMRFTVSEISQLTPLAAADLTFWGFPADPVNDDQRFPKGAPGSPAGCIGDTGTSCLKGPTEASVPPGPLTQNPSECTGSPLTATIQVWSYQDPDNPSADSADYPATTDCERQTFNPVLRAGLTTNETDSPTGLDLTMKAPQFIGYSASPSPIKDVTVTLSDGLTINPDAADGQTACPDALANFGSESPGNCPDNSKIGNFQIGSPALSGPLLGSLYIGEPQPGNQYRIFMVADGFGLHVKLTGDIVPDPLTGRVSIFFRNLPQVPFETFDVHLFASDRGILATPTHCTVYEIGSQFTPWNRSFAPQRSNPILGGINSGPEQTPCPGQIRPFAPRLVAGTSNPEAGDFSSFHLRLERDDGDQYLGDLNFKMPPGFTGDLRGISYCSEQGIARAGETLGRTETQSPSCPASSQIGTTNVKAGPGSYPFNAVGSMYLAGPLKGAPLSLVAITPALAGPYDYGNVVVRVALQVDQLTAQVSALSDTVPSIIGGIPIRIRSLQVNIDRPNFTINPTNCDVMSVDSQGIGDQGTVTDFSSYFHAANCGSLPFKPKMKVKQLGGKGQTPRTKHPSYRFDLRTRSGDANIRSLSVTLPKALAIEQSHLGNLCSERELAATRCAGRAAIGKATVDTPLLDQPLTGSAYAVSGSGGLPRLAFVLDGQVSLTPRAESKTVEGGKLKTTVPVIPDAPIGHFALTLFGDKRSYLVNTRNLCSAPVKVDVRYSAQSGKAHREQITMKTACGKVGKAPNRR